jgi:putative glycosyltransferase (TIGR04372 family)
MKITPTNILHGIVTLIHIPLLIVIYVIQPLVKIKFGYFSTGRIGHFALDLGYAIAENKNKKSVNLYYLQDTVSNSQLETIARRELNVNQYYRYFVYAYILLGLKNIIILPNRYKSESVGSRDAAGITLHSQYEILLLDGENKMAELYMKKHGWNKGEMFVCLNVRDQAFFDELKASRHAYRNTDINDYVDTVNYLLDLGYWVIRMGKKVEKSLNINHNKFIDYGMDQDRSDLLDIWFCKNCQFFISTGTGIDSVAIMFKKQTVFVNHLPIIHIHSWVNSIGAPKKLFWNSGKELSLTEHLDNSYVNTYKYKEKGINIVNLSSEEIKSVTQEMVARLDNVPLTDRQIQDQDTFWSVLEHHELYSKYHNVRDPNASFSLSFLKDRPNFLS